MEMDARSIADYPQGCVSIWRSWWSWCVAALVLRPSRSHCLLRLGCLLSLNASRAPMWHHLGAQVVAFGNQVDQIWHSWVPRVAPWAPEGVTVSASWLPEGWFWGAKEVILGTMGEPWWPHGAATKIRSRLALSREVIEAPCFDA